MIIIKIIIVISIIIIYLILLTSNNIKREKKKIYLSYELLDIYSILYSFARNKYIRPKFPKIKEKIYSINQTKNGICICSIVKKENLNIRKFVEYYLLLGINKIIIYDNNDIEGEKIEDTIKEYIKKRKVEIIDVRGMTSIQIPIYNHCYQKNNNLYDWIGIIDIDEYLYIKNSNNINLYFFNKKFQKCELIYFNWLIYNENDIKSLTKKEFNKSFYIFGKSFVRGGFINLFIPSSHIPGINIHYFCNSNGKRIFPKDFYSNKIEKNPKAYIRHYYSRTIEEICNKINKGNAQFNKKNPDYIYTTLNRIKTFFSFNKISDNKIQFLENCTGIKIKNFFKDKT